jgi:hypothetical protein
LLHSDENAGKPELVVSWIVKVCKGGGKWLGKEEAPEVGEDESEPGAL